MTTHISINDFIEEGRMSVLNALDDFVREKLDHKMARGWKDRELPELFKGIDAHLRSVAIRINEGYEPGSSELLVDL